MSSDPPPLNRGSGRDSLHADTVEEREDSREPAAGARTASMPHPERASAAVWRWRGASEETSAAGGARRRSLVRGGVGLALAALLALWQPILGAVAGLLAVLLLTLALASPRRLYPRIERWLAAFARGAALAVSAVSLTLVHLLVFLPLGLLLRATGRLRLVRTPDPGASTYWRAPDTPRPGARSHERQF